MIPKKHNTPATIEIMIAVNLPTPEPDRLSSENSL